MKFLTLLIFGWLEIDFCLIQANFVHKKNSLETLRATSTSTEWKWLLNMNFQHAHTNKGKQIQSITLNWKKKNIFTRCNDLSCTIAGMWWRISSYDVFFIANCVVDKIWLTMKNYDFSKSKENLIFTNGEKCACIGFSWDGSEIVKVCQSLFEISWILIMKHWD